MAGTSQLTISAKSTIVPRTVSDLAFGIDVTEWTVAIAAGV